jgi:hypothetical protein
MHVGQIFGFMVNGWAMDCFGFKKTQIAGLLVMSGLFFIQFFAMSIEMLLVGELLIGFPLGIFLTLPTFYAAEICPMVLRPYLTTYVNLCYSIGKYISRNPPWFPSKHVPIVVSNSICHPVGLGPLARHRHTLHSEVSVVVCVSRPLGR